MKPRRTHLLKWLDALRSSYWFLPAVLVLVGGMLAAAAVHFDSIGFLAPEDFPEWIRVRDPGAARAVLTTIAGATITIVSLAFSITIVALTLASSQFGSRLLYNFMRDRNNQAVLGVILGTFVYCLLVLAAVRSGEHSLPPQLGMTVALLLSLVSIAVLIFFIHHVAESIQATNVILRVGRELDEVIDRTLPALDDAVAEEQDAPEGGAEVCARRTGTLQAVDEGALVELARREDAEIVIQRRPGDYVLEGTVVARMVGVEACSDELAAEVHEALILGGRRTLVQDLEFALYQLVEVAVRALSPGINDPFTAMGCIDELGSALVRAAQRAPMPRRLVDEEGRVRVFLDTTDFAGLVGTAFEQVRQHGQRDLGVMLRLLEVLAEITPLMRTEEQREALLHQGELAYALAEKHATTDSDRADLADRRQALTSAAG